MDVLLINDMETIIMKLNEIEMDLITQQMKIINIREDTEVDMTLIERLNHYYIFEEEHNKLYMGDERDLYDILYERLDEYMDETQMSMWKDPEYLDTIYDWFMSECIPFVQSMDVEYCFFKEMSHKKHVDMVHTAFLYCFVQWMRVNNVDFRSIGVPDKMVHYQCLKREQREIIERKIYVMDEKNAECAIQGTQEWLDERGMVLTASVAWKAMDTEANRKSLILEKTSGESGFSGRRIPLDTMNPLQKGHCYEPISVMLYEHIFNTKIADYGCLKHSKYNFIGASPDGLNVDASSPKYGRLLEIKNVTSRALTGLPKKDYWVQMQIQMEVCDLDECDFFECDFKEYESEEAFMSDGDRKTAKGQWKGCYAIVCVADEYQYKYCPIGENIREWLDDIKKNDGWAYIKTRYWWLDTFSCVLVPRNRKWFQYAVKDLESIWEDIQKVKNGEVQMPVKGSRIKVIKKDIDKDVCVIDMKNMGMY